MTCAQCAKVIEAQRESYKECNNVTVRSVVGLYMAINNVSERGCLKRWPVCTWHTCTRTWLQRKMSLVEAYFYQ